MKKIRKYDKYDLISKLSASHGTIMELNKKVKWVKIELDFSDNDYDNPGLISKILLPEEKLFYCFNCLNETCTKGFFNFTDVLYSAIRENKTYAIGELPPCDGYEEEGNLNYKCGCKVHYEITINYEAI